MPDRPLPSIQYIYICICMYVCKSGLLISKYRVSLILYRRYFFSIGEGIVNTFEKSVDRDIANTLC